MAGDYLPGGFPPYQPGGTVNLLGPDGRPINDGYLANDGMALPHVVTYASIFNSAQKTYWHDRWDNAMRFSRQSALVMRNDAYPAVRAIAWRSADVRLFARAFPPLELPSLARWAAALLIVV